MNRSGKVNTDIAMRPENSSLESQLARRANSLQKGA